MSENHRCTFCEEPFDDVTIGSDGITKACSDCIAEGNSGE